MRKILLFCAAALAAVTMTAKEVTIDCKTAFAGMGVSGTGGAISYEQDGVTFECTKGYGDGTYGVRCYKGSTITISATSIITKIQFTFPTVSGKLYDGGLGVTEVTPNATSWTWENLESQARLNDNLVITLDDSGTVVTVNKPTIEGSEMFETSTTVTITADAGCTIYYSLDGNTPDVDDPDCEYTGPLTLTNTATVKAVAVDAQGNKSQVASKTFTKTSTGTIADAHKAAVGAVMTVNAVLVAENAMGYVAKDATGIIYVYDSNQAGKFDLGDEVTLTGTIAQYGEKNQFTNTTITKNGTSTVEYPTPTVLDGEAMDALLTNFNFAYVQITGDVSVSSGKYYNITVEGASTAQGSVISPNDAQKTKLTNGSNVTLKGYALYVTSSKYINVIVTDVTVNGEAEPPTPLTLAELNNGGMEEWTDGYPNQWKSTTTASSASTVSQSTDAHTGTYSAQMATSSTNRRMATTEVNLPAGDYTIAFYAKAANAGETTAVRVGYAKTAIDGAGYAALSSNSYVYTTSDNIEVGSDWTKVEQYFTLEEETIVNLLIMLPKNQSDVLVDDVTVVNGLPEGISVVNTTNKVQAIYDLQGRKLNKVQTGVNIVNGAKVLVK